MLENKLRKPISPKRSISELMHTEYLALAALFLGAIAIGASPIFVRLSELGPFGTAFYRPALAIPVVVLWVRLSGSGASQPQSFRDIIHSIIAGGLFAGDLAFWHLSIHNTSVANAAFFATSTPIFVVVTTSIFFHQRLTAIFLVGMLITIFGVAVLLVGDLQFDVGHIKGDMYGLVAAIFFAGYLVTISRLRKRLSTSTVMIWSSIGTAIALLPIAVVSSEPMFAETIYGWVILFGLAIVSHAMGQGLVAFSLSELTVNFSSIGILIEPISATLLAFLILGESLTTWQIVGGIVIISGIIVARKGNR